MIQNATDTVIDFQWNRSQCATYSTGFRVTLLADCARTISSQICAVDSGRGHANTVRDAMLCSTKFIGINVTGLSDGSTLRNARNEIEIPAKGAVSERNYSAIPHDWPMCRHNSFLPAPVLVE